MAQWEPGAVRRRAGLDLAASGPVPCRLAPRPGQPERPRRRCPPASRRGRPALRRPLPGPGLARPARGRRGQNARRQGRPARRSGPAALRRTPPAVRWEWAAPRRTPPAPRWVRRRFWLPGQAACPAARSSDPRPRWRVRLVCLLRAPPPRLRRRPPRGGRRGRPSAARAGTVPWTGVLGGRQGLLAQVVRGAAPHRRAVAWAGRPWDRAPQTSGRQEQRGARDADADGPQDRPGRAAYRAGPAVRRLGGFQLARESIPLGLAAARRWAAPAGPRRPESVGLAWATPAWPRPTASLWPRLLGPVWPRPVAPAWPRQPVLAWPRRAGSAVAVGVVWGAVEALPVLAGSRWAGWANRGAGTGAVGFPRVGWVLVRTPGWMPTGRRRGPPGPRARVGGLRYGW
jgi:hypothetical protein